MSPEIERIIQQSLDTIEDNLRAQITPQELSEQAGFSLYHYYRIFEAATGMSVMRYITRRRLLHAAYAMSRGTDATAAAMEFGFDTHAGFYKAFRREFGCAPSRYLRTHRAARPFRINLKEVTRMADSKIIAQALKEWGMERAPVTNIYYTNTGNRSESTFFVGDAHVLKCSARLGELHRQAALQRTLFAHGLAAKIVPAADGREIVRIGEMDFMLNERLKGRPANAMQMMAESQQAHAVGEGLARLHAALRECDPLLCAEEDLLATLRDWAVPAAQRAMNLDSAYVQTYLDRFAALYPQLPKQIVHRDPNPDNIFLLEGRVEAFLDFDLSRILPRIFDICYAATGVLSDAFTRVDSAKQPAFFDVAQAIWHGYHAVAPLTDAEKQALPDMVIAIQMICVAAFSGTEKFAELAETNRRMLRMMLENDEKLNVNW